MPSSGLSTVRIARVNSISGTKDRSVNVEIVLLDIFMGLFSFSCSFCFSREGERDVSAAISIGLDVFIGE